MNKEGINIEVFISLDFDKRLYMKTLGIFE